MGTSDGARCSLRDLKIKRYTEHHLHFTLADGQYMRYAVTYCNLGCIYAAGDDVTKRCVGIAEKPGGQYGVPRPVLLHK
jgi:hypothetical protein